MDKGKKKYKGSSNNLIGAFFNVLYLGAYALNKSTRSISAVRNAYYLAKNLKKL